MSEASAAYHLCREAIAYTKSDSTTSKKGLFLVARFVCPPQVLEAVTT